MVIRLVLGPGRQCPWALASSSAAEAYHLVGPAGYREPGRQVGTVACRLGGPGCTVTLPLMTMAWSGAHGYSITAWRAITVATPRHLWLIVHRLQGEGRPPARSRSPLEAACPGLAAFWSVPPSWDPPPSRRWSSSSSRPRGPALRPVGLRGLASPDILKCGQVLMRLPRVYPPSHYDITYKGSFVMCFINDDYSHCWHAFMKIYILY